MKTYMTMWYATNELLTTKAKSKNQAVTLLREGRDWSMRPDITPEAVFRTDMVVRKADAMYVVHLIHENQAYHLRRYALTIHHANCLAQWYQKGSCETSIERLL